MAKSQYVVKVGDKYVQDSGRLSDEFPDAWEGGLREACRRAKAAAARHGEPALVWKDYGADREAIAYASPAREA